MFHGLAGDPSQLNLKPHQTTPNQMLTRLAAAVGSRSQAARELRWMQSAVDSGHALPLQHMVHRRSSGEPLQYILGTQPFGPLNLLTRPPVLIPRPETEHWVLRLADAMVPNPQNPLSLLDLGTGSGCIPLLLCHLWPPGSLRAHAVDVSPHALRLAGDNASCCRIPSFSNNDEKPQNTFTTTLANILDNNFPDSITSLTSAPFDIITSNPPYISWKDYIQLDHSVQDFEDRGALLGGSSGLEFYHSIARLMSHRDILKPNGVVALEVGFNQAKEVESLMLETGRFRRTEIWLDPWEKQRTVIAYM